MLAIKKAALAGIRKWNYVNGILKAWKNEGVKTIGDVQSRDERRNPPAGQQQKPSAAEDYNEIFGEAWEVQHDRQKTDGVAGGH